MHNSEGSDSKNAKIQVFCTFKIQYASEIQFSVDSKTKISFHFFPDTYLEPFGLRIDFECQNSRKNGSRTGLFNAKLHGPGLQLGLQIQMVEKYAMSPFTGKKNNNAITILVKFLHKFQISPLKFCDFGRSGLDFQISKIMCRSVFAKKTRSALQIMPQKSLLLILI